MVVSIVAPELGLPALAAITFSTAVIATAAAEGAAIDRLVGSATASSTAEAATSPATARTISAPDGTGPLLHPVPDQGPVLLGTPIAEPGPTLLGTPIAAPGHPILDHPIDSPRPGFLGHPLQEPQPLYNALDVSETPKPTEEAEQTTKPTDQGKRNTPDQQAVIELAKEAKRRGGITRAEAEVLKQLAKEAGVPFRGPQSHPKRPYGRIPHIHVGPVDHIPVRDEL